MIKAPADWMTVRAGFLFSGRPDRRICSPCVLEHFIGKYVKSQGFQACAADGSVQESFTIFPIVKRALL
jgi:hypothetical protein